MQQHLLQTNVCVNSRPETAPCYSPPLPGLPRPISLDAPREASACNLIALPFPLRLLHCHFFSPLVFLTGQLRRTTRGEPSLLGS